jgi:hypothetical protein
MKNGIIHTAKSVQICHAAIRYTDGQTDENVDL